MHKSVKRAILLLIVVIAVGTTLLYGYTDAERRSHCSLTVSTNNRTTFSDVYVLIDHTESMSDADVLSAKEIVNDRILSKLGVNDTVSCYELGGKFEDSTSTVFGAPNEQPPSLAGDTPQKILDLVKAKGSPRQPAACDNATTHLIEQVKVEEADANSKRESWQNKVKSLQRPAIDGSDYVAALDGIVRSMANYEKQPGRDTWLVIVGDLKNESPTKRSVHGDDAAFKNFNHILLVYPFNANDAKWAATEKFWEDYFGDIRYERHSFAEALRSNFLIAPNPASGFETHEGEGFWRLFLPFFVPTIVAATLVICLVYVRRFRRVGKHAQVPDARPVVPGEPNLNQNSNRS